MISTCTIRLDEGVLEETTRIAAEMGLSFNDVMNNPDSKIHRGK